VDASPPGSPPLPEIPIPDNDPTGVTIDITLRDPEGRPMGNEMLIGELVVQLGIEHPRRGDLVASLVCSNGTEVPLLAQEGGEADDVYMSRDIMECVASSATGTFKLKVRDVVAGNVGAVQQWGLSAVPMCR
jgi:subtilisin-like proprotein convertase family protein